MFAEAFRGLQQNLRTLALYVALIVSLHSGLLIANLEFIEPVKETLDPLHLNLYKFSTTILTALCWACIQSICYARFGHNIDRPFWKVDGDWEALRRFFKLWFLLDLGALTLFSVPDALLSATGDETLALAFFYFALAVAILAAPFGTAVMFNGKFGREEVKAAATTLVNQLPRVFVIMILTYCVAMLLSQLLIAETMTPWLSPLVYIVDAYFDCLIFCCIWHLCMVDRDEDTEDIDFDF
jgi:hypothetical protein